MNLVLPFNKCIVLHILKRENAKLFFQVCPGKSCSILNPCNLFLFCAHLLNYQICSCKPHESKMSSKDMFEVLGSILTTYFPVLVMDHLQAKLQTCLKKQFLLIVTFLLVIKP